MIDTIKGWFDYGKCFMCKDNRFFVRKRTLNLKFLNQPITSRERICGSCTKKVLRMQEGGNLI